MKTIQLIFLVPALALVAVGCGRTIEPGTTPQGLEEVQEQKIIEDNLVVIKEPDIDLTNDQKLEETLDAFYAELEDSFRMQYDEVDDDEMGKEHWLLQIETSVARNDSLMISLIAQTYIHTGGAHGNIFYHTWNYDRKNAVILDLTDILVEEGDPLTEISELSVAQLLEDSGSDEEWVRGGASPEISNFASWTLNADDSLHFIFDPYQVGPYAGGAQFVELGFDEIGGLIHRDYLSTLVSDDELLVPEQ